MDFSTPVKKRYTTDHLSALEAQRQAEFIAWAPVVFQASRLMVKFGILQLIEDAKDGLTREDIVQKTQLSDYAVKCLLEASLSIGLIIVDDTTNKFSLTKTGWFLLNDHATSVNLTFNHDVNYMGMFRLEEALRNGRPEGLKFLGDWSTLYEGLSQFPTDVRDSWLNFDHYYSDGSFPEALKVVFDNRQIRSLYDVGGNTGKWALQCVEYSPDVRVTLLDLPQQIQMMQENVKGKPGAERISGYPVNLLDPEAQFPACEGGLDAIWMSQFLDCFSMDEIVCILKRAKEVMTSETRLFIMETLWDRQRFETSAFCLTMTSLYFTAMANGNSKMYNTEDLAACIQKASLQIEQIHDHLGLAHTLLVCKS